MAEPSRILIYNPNSSQSILDGLKSILEPIKEDGIEIDYRSGPNSAPESINDVITSIQSSKVGFDDLIGKDKGEKLSKTYKAILVCCFSHHPLVKMLENFFSKNKINSIKVMHLLQSGLLASLAFSAPAGNSIGIITTGKEMVKDIDDGIASFFGSSAKSNDRYAGCIATGLGVLQLRDPSQQEIVENTIRQHSAELAKRGVGAIMLGCAGMAGMEHIVRKGLADHLGEQANQIAIIDTAKAGLLLLTAQIRMNREFLP